MLRGEPVSVDEIENASDSSSERIDERTWNVARVLVGAAASHLRGEHYDFEAHGVTIGSAALTIDGVKSWTHHVVEASMLLVRGLLSDVAQLTDEPAAVVADRLAVLVEMYAAIGYAENVVDGR